MIRFNLTDGGSKLAKIGTVLYIVGLVFLGNSLYDMGKAEVYNYIQDNADIGGLNYTTDGKTKTILFKTKEEGDENGNYNQ